MKQESLWVCPLCHTDAGGPVKTCPSCQCNLLLLAKLRMESLHALQRAENIKASILAMVPPLKEKTSLLRRLLSLRLNR